MLAAMNGHAAATRILLERGSDINSHIETNRNTALTLACFQGRTEVVRLLLEYNANVEHRAKVPKMFCFFQSVLYSRWLSKFHLVWKAAEFRWATKRRREVA